MAEQTHVSMIHPDLYNRTLQRQGIEGIEVVDGATGLEVKYDDAAGSIPKLVNVVLNLDVALNMVVDSNLGKLKTLQTDLRMMTNHGTFRDADDRTYMEEVVESLESVVENLGNMLKEQRR